MKIYTTIILVFSLFFISTGAAGNNDEQQLSDYEKVFKDKKVESKKGVITLHKVEDKVYFEYPIKLLNKDIIMGSTIEEVSDIGEAFVGQQTRKPLYIRFIKNDTIISVAVKSDFSSMVKSESGIKNAIQKSSIPAILHNFGIVAYNKDSTSVLFDATSLFLTDNNLYRPIDIAGQNSFGGLVVRRADYVNNRSFIKEVNSFPNNFSVTVFQSYNITSSFFGVMVLEKDKPYTALTKRSFIFLPEKTYKPRIADPRIGIQSEMYNDFSSQNNRVDKKYYVKRWRLQPSDTAAYKEGKLVEPIKPIVFYIDHSFPSKWFEYIKSGVETWNLAFEKIGFKNAVVALPFPENDTSFDYNNLAYNYIRYVPTTQESLNGHIWIDPRNGEILSTSIYVNHNISSYITMQRFILTSSADKTVRTQELPDSIIGESIKQLITRQVGNSIGLSNNLAASAAFPVDSLRSPSFTNKHGITPSIMDQIDYNYVAQPGDKERGVRLTPLELGEYDYYTIKWLYTPIFTASMPEEEVSTLTEWIKSKQNNPIYRYGTVKSDINYDPTVLSGDLGDNAIKSSNYGIQNLKHIVQNTNKWLENEDLDYSFRSKVYSNIIEQLSKYVNYVTTSIGGVYINPKIEGDPYDLFTPISKEEQKEALLYLLNLVEDLSWMDNEPEKDNIEIMASISDYCRIMFIPKIFNRIDNMDFNSHLSSLPYKIDEVYNDIFEYVFRFTMSSKAPTAANRQLQNEFVTTLLDASGLEAKKIDLLSMLLSGVTSSNKNYSLHKTDGFEPLPKFKKENHKLEYIAYGNIIKIHTLLNNSLNIKDDASKNHYKLLLAKIDKALEKK